MLKQLTIGHDAHVRHVSSFNDICKAETSFLSEVDDFALLSHKNDMTDEGAPLYRLLLSIKPENLTENAWAKRAEVNRNVFQSIKSGKRPRTDTLEKLVRAIGYTPAQFYDLEGGPPAEATEVPHDDLPFHRRDEPQDIPLVGTAQGSDYEVGENGEIIFIERMDLDMENVIDHVRRPSSLAGRKDIYAITVIGDSMADRYMDGDPAYVDARRQPRAGDYVVVQLVKRDGDGEGRVRAALLKRLIRKTSTLIELSQTNPPARFTIPAKDVADIHRVIPWNEIVFF